MNQFHKTLNAHYVSTHFGNIRSVTQDQFESYARYYKRSIMPFFPSGKEARILDVGCGLGHFLYFLKREGYVNHWGIDIGQEQIDFCYRSVTEQVEVVKDTQSYLIEHQQYYDVIVFIDVFEHLNDDELLPMLDAVRGALTTSGKLIVSVPNAACMTSLMTLYGDITHRRLFTEGSLIQLLAAVGFENVQIFPHEKKVIRSYRSRRERWMWEMRDKFVRWLMSEFYLHLMEGAYPQVQTINLLGVAEIRPKTLETLVR